MLTTIPSLFWLLLAETKWFPGFPVAKEIPPKPDDNNNWFHDTCKQEQEHGAKEEVFKKIVMSC